MASRALIVEEEDARYYSLLADLLRSDDSHIRESVLSQGWIGRDNRAGLERVARNCGFHTFPHAGSPIVNELTRDLMLSVQPRHVVFRLRLSAATLTLKFPGAHIG